MIKKSLLSILIIFCSTWLSAQKISHFEIPGYGPHLIEFTGQESYTLQDIDQVFVKYYPIKEGYTYKITNTIQDELGYTHKRYQFYFKGQKVIGSTLIAHLYKGHLKSINGHFYQVLNQKASVTKEAALQLTLDHVKAQTYMWEIKEEEQEIKKIDDNPNATYFPSPELCYVPRNLDFNADYILSYSLKVYAHTPLSYKEYYVNASTGEIIANQNLLMDAHDSGTAVTAYSGNRQIYTDSFATNNFRLRDSVRDVRTFDMNQGTNYGLAVDFTDADNFWNNVNANEDEVATDAHWGAEMTYDYFLQEHSRNSYDDNGARILSYVHFRANYDNAFWDGRRMTYGDGNNFKPLTSIDVCGHEIAHAVTTNTAGLIYRNESGQLNESFSDIFGNSVEAWARLNQHSWIIGEDITTSGNGLRNMQNPNLRNHPKYYKGFRWYYGTGDNGGVHLNSGVQNYWYYLITEGDTGTNEKGDAYAIEKLGLSKAGKIAYRNLSVYLSQSSNYAEARIYAIKSAADLYGECNKEVISTTNAWFVCGVGDRYDSTTVSVDFIADTLICSTSQIVNFSNRSTNFNFCIWDFGDGNTTNVIDPTHQYGTYASFDIKLKARSCFGDNWDSLTKTAYVKVDSTQDICNAIFLPNQGTDSVSFCDGYIYDEGGLDDYRQNKITYLKVTSPNADSITLTFEDLDYEVGYDTLTLYAGPPVAGNEIGKYFNTTLPNGGLPIVIPGDYISFRQWSDPFVVGRGFKAKFKAHKQPLSLSANQDTTICVGNPINLMAIGSGGYDGDYQYVWNNDTNVSSYIVYPSNDSLYRIELWDVCTKEYVYDSVQVTMRDSLKIIARNDTLICDQSNVNVTMQATGGQMPYSFVWDNGQGAGASKVLTPATNTTYQVYVTDNCTVLNDTTLFQITLRPPLSLTLSSSESIICKDQPVTLKATHNGGDTIARKVTWQFDGSQLDSLVFSPTTSGWYKATVSDNCSPSIEDSIYLTVLPELAISKQADTTICKGSNVNIWVLASGGKSSNYTYTWNNGIGNVNNFLAAVTTKTTYHLTLSDGCSPDFVDSVVIDVFDDLSLTKPRDSTICFGQSYTINLTGAGGRGSNYTYTWDNGLGTGASKTVQPTISTNYEIVLDDGCTIKNDTQQVIVTVRNALTVTSMVAPSQVCLGESSSLTYTTQGGKLPHVVTVDGVLSTSPLVINPTLSKNSYWVKVTDGCSNPDSMLVNILVNPLPNFNLSTDKLALCVGDSVQLTHDYMGAATYNWDVNGIQQSNQNSFNWKPNQQGAFEISLHIIDGNNCNGYDTLKPDLDVQNAPIAVFDFTPIDPDIENNTITFINQSVFASQYEWNFGDNSSLENAFNTSHLYTDTGTYTITLRINNAIGCQDQISKMIRIKPVYKLFIPTAFSPNGDGRNDEFGIVGTGITEVRMQIFNRWGEKLTELEGVNLSWNGKVQDKVVPIGIYIYYIEIKDINGERHNIKDKFLILR